MRYHGIPPKLVKITKLLYKDFKSSVVCGNTLTDSFTIHTGVKQGCILSPFLFVLAIDWLMKTTTKGKRRGIRWTLTSCLEDLDFADDICLLSSSHKDMQRKTEDLNKNGQKIGLKIHPVKTKVMKMNTKLKEPVRISGENIEEVESFTYLGSTMT